MTACYSGRREDEKTRAATGCDGRDGRLVSLVFGSYRRRDTPRKRGLLSIRNVHPEIRHPASKPTGVCWLWIVPSYSHLELLAPWPDLPLGDVGESRGRSTSSIPTPTHSIQSSRGAGKHSASQNGHGSSCPRVSRNLQAENIK